MIQSHIFKSNLSCQPSDVVLVTQPHALQDSQTLSSPTLESLELLAALESAVTADQKKIFTVWWTSESKESTKMHVMHFQDFSYVLLSLCLPDLTEESTKLVLSYSYHIHSNRQNLSAELP